MIAMLMIVQYGRHAVIISFQLCCFVFTCVWRNNKNMKHVRVVI